MKIFHATAAHTNLESQWSLPDYRWDLWCAAFQVNDLTGYFDMAPADSAIRVVTFAIERFDTHTEQLRALLDPNDFEGMRGNKRRLQGIRTFLTRNGGHISGAFDEAELYAVEGDPVELPHPA
ncbi:hypothetical protein [Nocardia cyriacigeorgica]|uniref:hypothetical protein n=1 Tax=Nocardia cyriacigeorgica TaxID=135487 RepID=UPI00245657CA|nr:hypothetical protein [Nocardia cyriacigeorgica]